MNKGKILIGGHQLSWSTSIATRDVLPRAKKIKELGCGAFEFFLSADPFPASAIKGAMEKAGLASIGCAVIRDETGGDPLSTNEAIRSVGEKVIKKYIARTCDMGSSLLVGPLANVLGRKDAQCPTQDELKAGVKTFGKVAKFAESRKIRVAIEALQWVEMPWPNRISQVIQFIKQVEEEPGVPKGVLGVLFDIYHAFRMEENWHAALNLALNAKKLFHVHVAGPNRTPPHLDQHINWTSMISILKNAQWDGGITIESFGKECDLPFAVIGPGERLPAEQVISIGVETLKAAGL